MTAIEFPHVRARRNNALAGLAAALRKALSARRPPADLREFSDHMLRDIGLIDTGLPTKRR